MTSVTLSNLSIASANITTLTGTTFGTTATTQLRGASAQITNISATSITVTNTPAFVGNGTLTMNVSGTGLSGSQTFTANQSGNATFTVTSNATTTAGAANTIVARDGNGYIFNNYFNSTDNSVASGVTAVMVKQGDSYLRSGTAAAIATFISGQTMNIAGNASTATNLSTGSSNWSTNGTITAVVGLMAWKNYGNNHVIFDASAGTAPNGTAVNNTNSQGAWTASYPTLMGWNGSNTYGVRVDSCRIADTVATASSPIQSIQRGSGSHYGTIDITISSVNTAKASVRYLGTAPSGTAMPYWSAQGYMALTSSTNLRVVTVPSAGPGQWYSWEVVEFK